MLLCEKPSFYNPTKSVDYCVLGSPCRYGTLNEYTLATTALMNIENSFNTYSPEIHNFFSAGLFRRHTLKTLGFQSSEQALACGYTKIRLADHQSRKPAYWIAACDVSTYLYCIGTIVTLREARRQADERSRAHNKQREQSLIASLDDDGQKMLLRYKKNHPNVTIDGLSKLVDRHHKIVDKFEDRCRVLNGVFTAPRVRVSLDEENTRSQLIVGVPVDVPRPEGGRLLMVQEFRLDIPNNITDKQWSETIKKLRRRSTRYVHALERVSAAAARCHALGTARAFSTLFIKVINGATSPSKLKSGLKRSLFNDVEGRRALALLFHATRPIGVHDVNLHSLPDEGTPMLTFALTIRPGIVVTSQLSEPIINAMLSNADDMTAHLATTMHVESRVLLEQLRTGFTRTTEQLRKTAGESAIAQFYANISGVHTLKTWRAACQLASRQAETHPLMHTG